METPDNAVREDKHGDNTCAKKLHFEVHVSGREDNSPVQIWQPWVTQKGYRRENIPIDEPFTDPLRMIIKSNSLNYDLDD